MDLPSFDIDLSKDARGRTCVYDVLRRKRVVLTPEEWVRQHFVNYLIHHLGYPQGLMANEIGLKLNGMRRRCDTVVYDRSARPIAIVEYKAPEVPITQQVFDQIARYNIVIGARVLIVSNGGHHYCCRYDHQADTYKFLEAIPRYEEI